MPTFLDRLLVVVVASVIGKGGSGTVTMATAQQAQAAIQQFNQADFDGRIINVKLDARA